MAVCQLDGKAPSTFEELLLEKRLIDQVPQVGVDTQCRTSGDGEDQSGIEEGVRYIMFKGEYELFAFRWIICHLGIYGEPVGPDPEETKPVD